MSLFKCCNKPIKFVLCHVDETELQELKILIVANGGIFSSSDPFVQIKFTQIHKYSDYDWSGAKVYNVQFIWHCVEQSKIVDPEPYKLSPKFMHDECLMSHFLFGSCDCASLLKAQVSASAPSTSNSVNTFFTPPTQFSEMTSTPSRNVGGIEGQLNLSTGPKLSKNRYDSSASTLSTSNDRHSNSPNDPIGAQDAAKTVASSNDDVDPLNISSPLDESQTVVGSLFLMNRQAIAMKMSGGDGAAVSMIDGHEKNCCSSEYRKLVEPKLQMLDRQRKRHLRTPTTLDTAGDMPPTVMSSEARSGDLERYSKLSVSPGCSNAKSVNVAKYSNGKKNASSPTMSKAFTMVRNNSPRPENGRKRFDSPFRSIAMQNPPNDNNPVAKYMRCKEGRRQLFSKNLQSSTVSLVESKSSKKSENNSIQNSSRSKNSHNKPAPRLPIQSESDKSDDEVLISRAHCQCQKASSSENDRKNDRGNEPGPSHGVGRHRILTHADIISGASSSDEVNSSIEKDRHLERIGKKDQKKSANITPCIWKCPNVDRDDVIVLLSSDDEERTSTSARKKVKTTVSGKSSKGKKTSKNGISEHQQNGKNSLMKHSPSNANAASVQSKFAKTSSSEVTRESSRTNGKSRNIDNEMEISDPLDSNSKSLAGKTKERVTEKSRMTVICKNRADLARQAELNAISIKLANNKNSKLKAEARKRKLLIQDSETEDEGGDDDDDDSRMTSVQYENRNKTTKKSLTSKDDDRRAAKRKRKEHSRNRISSADSDASSNILPAVSSKTASKSKSAPKNVPNNRSNNRQQDEDIRSSSSSADFSIECEDDVKIGPRMLYTDSETNEMIKFLVRTQSIAVAKGRKIYEEMSKEKKLRHRTPMSLYNRFQKILPDIERWAAALRIHPDIIAQFTDLKRPRR